MRTPEWAARDSNWERSVLPRFSCGLAKLVLVWLVGPRDRKVYNEGTGFASKPLETRLTSGHAGSSAWMAIAFHLPDKLRAVQSAEAADMTPLETSAPEFTSSPFKIAISTLVAVVCGPYHLC